MAFATGTTNYGLPQWGENEHVEISPDINEAFADIDTQMKANQDNINLVAVEGDWTPTITFGTGSSGITYNQTYTVGHYIKIKNMVYVQGSVVLTNKGSSVGAVNISMPFSVRSGTYAPITIGSFSGISYVGCISGFFTPGSDKALMQHISEAGNIANIGEGNFANNAEFKFSGFYVAIN